MVINDKRPSALYTLEPRGENTIFVEGLTSHIVHLALAHSVRTSNLIQKVIISDVVKSPKKWGTSQREEAHTINGYGVQAHKFAKRVGELTNNLSTTNLTCINLEKCFSGRGNHLLKPTKHWCPACYKEAFTDREQLYDPLYWSLRSTSLCLIHNCELACHCPSCGAAQNYIPVLPFLDYCHNCGHWLAEHDVNVVDFRLKENKIKRWLSATAADVLHRLQDDNSNASFENAKELIRDIINKHANNQIRLFSETIGFPYTTISDWLGGKGNPGFSIFLEFCLRLQCDPVALLRGQGELTDVKFWSRGQMPVYQRRKKRSKNVIEELEKQLKEIIKKNPDPHPSFAEIASQVNCTKRFLRHKFPELSETLRIRSLESIQRENNKRAKERKKRLIKSVAKLKAKERVVSERALRSKTGVKSSDLRRDDIKNLLSTLK